MLENHTQSREALDHTGQLLVDEAFFTVEHIHFGAGHLAVHQQRQTDLGHGFERREDLVQAGHPGIGVGGRPGRVQFGGMHETTGLGAAHVIGRGVVGEVQHHQRLEAAAGRTRRENALAVDIGLGGIAHRRHQIGHDDGAAEGACGITDGLRQGGTVTQVDVPVIGAQQGNTVGHGGFPGGQNVGECYRKRPIAGQRISPPGRQRSLRDD